MQERRNCERIRILAVIGLIFVLIMAIAGGKTTVQAAGASVGVSSASAEKGETVKINVTLSNNPGIYGIKVKVDYNSSALQLNSMSNGNIFPASEAVCNISKGIYVATANGYDNITANGTLFTLEFNVIAGANTSSYDISATVEKAQSTDSNVSVSAGSGKVTVEKCIHNKKWKVIKEASCETKGEQANVCTKCGESFETKEIPATGHKNTELRNQTAATTTSEGYSGDTYCKDCGKMISSGKAIAKLTAEKNAGTKKTDSTVTGTKSKADSKTSNNTKSTDKKADSKKPTTEEKTSEIATEKVTESEIATETESESEITKATEKTEKPDKKADTKSTVVKKSGGASKALAVVIVIVGIGAIAAVIYFFIIRKKPGR